MDNPKHTFRRTTNTLLTINQDPRFYEMDHRDVHVRVWEAEDPARRVVLIGALDGDGPITASTGGPIIGQLIDTPPLATHVRDTQWYSMHRSEAYSPWRVDEVFYELLPDFSCNINGHSGIEYWLDDVPVTREAITETLGYEIERFPPGMYIRHLIERWIGGERPVHHLFDPWDLQSSIQTLRTLHRKINMATYHVDPPGERDVRKRRSHALTSAAAFIAAKIQSINISYRIHSSEISNEVVSATLPDVPDDVNTQLLQPLIEKNPHTPGIAELGRVYTYLKNYRSSNDPILRSALDEAIQEIGYHYRPILLNAAREKKKIPRRLTITSPMEQAYFRSISWIGTSDITTEEDDTATNLREVFWEDERPSPDRFGRDVSNSELCLYSPAAESIAVSCHVYVNFPEWDTECTYLSAADPFGQEAELVGYYGTPSLKPVLIDTYNR